MYICMYKTHQNMTSFVPQTKPNKLISKDKAGLQFHYNTQSRFIVRYMLFCNYSERKDVHEDRHACSGCAAQGTGPQVLRPEQLRYS